MAGWWRAGGGLVAGWWRGGGLVAGWWRAGGGLVAAGGGLVAGWRAGGGLVAGWRAGGGLVAGWWRAGGGLVAAGGGLGRSFWMWQHGSNPDAVDERPWRQAGLGARGAWGVGPLLKACFGQGGSTSHEMAALFGAFCWEKGSVGPKPHVAQFLEGGLTLQAPGAWRKMKLLGCKDGTRNPENQSNITKKKTHK